MQRVREFIREHMRKKQYRRVVTVLASIVVFCTVYALILPAVTLEEDTFCGIESHTHGDECYESVLVCTLEETAETHEHGDECYTVQRTLTCTLPESEGHTHTEDCYVRAGALICTLEENEEHTHGEGCYAEADTLVCGQEESEGHTHTDACYTEEKVLTCTVPTEGHTHTDACYEKKLVCTLEEHTHTLSCYSDPNADTEDASVWEKTIPQELTGTRAERVIAVAKSQLGYTESTRNYRVNEDGTLSGYTRYGAWFGMPYDEWCAMFASFCLNYGGVTQEEMPYASGCVYWIELLRNAGLYESASAQTPEAGDLVFFDSDGDGTSDHVGIITEVSQDENGVKTIATVEGNISGSVAAKSYPVSDSVIFGYGKLPAETDAADSGDADAADSTESTDGTDTADSTDATDTTDGTDATDTTDGTDTTGSTEATDTTETAETVEAAEDDAVSDDTAAVEADAVEGSNAALPGAEDGIAVAAAGDEVVDGGTFQSAEGSEMTWTLTKDVFGEYTLTIDGEGAIPDYSNSNPSPWSPYKGTTSYRLVIGDGVTRIGTESFSGSTITAIQIGTGVDTICKYAFGYSRLPEEVDIPGNVKTIKNGAFAYNYSSFTVTFHEGTETIESSAFYGSTVLGKVYIPASVTNIGGHAFCGVSSFVVAEDNPNYTNDENGVLYTKDMTELVVFPEGKYFAEFRIPDTVTTVSGLSAIGNIGKLIIPASVTSIALSYPGSGYKEIYFEDGSQIGKIDSYAMFYANSKLTTLHLPENTPLVLGTFGLGDTWTLLSSFEIPNGVTKIERNFNVNMIGLDTLRYNAADATFGTSANNICGTDAYFDLTIGKDVNTLAEKFSYFVEHATSISFEKNNQITIAEGAFANAPTPLTGLSGTVYIDGQGVLYSYDKDAGTAKVVYVPGDVKEVTIPASITPEEGVTVSVTAVGDNALSCAEQLQTLTFEAPEAITEIGTYGLGNCTTLTKLNGQTTEEAAEATFTNKDLKTGYGAFYNTGLEGAEGDGAGEQQLKGSTALTVSRDDLKDAADMGISVSSSGGTMSYTEGEDGKGGYTLLTGDTMTVTASLGNITAGSEYVYRMYLRTSGSDAAMSVTPGQSYTFDGNTVTCYATDDANTVYLEFQPESGSTVSIPVTAMYPSPTSAGGSLRIWGMILTKEEAASSAGTAVSASDEIDANWSTQRSDFALTKECTSDGTKVNVVGAADGTPTLSGNLSWSVKLERSPDTVSDYGRDYVRSVSFSDTVTLPEGMSWKSEVLEAVKNGTLYRRDNYLYVGDILVARVASNIRAELSEDGTNIVFRWKGVNTSPRTSEIGTLSYTFTVYADALTADLEKYDPNSTLTNTVDAAIRYTHSKTDTKTATAEQQIPVREGTLAMSKTLVGGNYFGDYITYTVTLTNTGAKAWTGDSDSYYVSDTLPTQTYISPENMEKMFTDAEHGGELTITISNAAIAPWQEVTSTDGGTAYRTSENSDVGESGKTITITKAEGGYTAAVTGGESCTASTIAEALQGVGYAVTEKAAYTVRWEFPKSADGKYTIGGGKVFTYKIYATVKNSFQLLVKDWPGKYNGDIWPNNRAYFKDSASQDAASSNWCGKRFYHDAEIAKSVYTESGVSLGATPKAGNGDVLAYQLDFQHYGDGEYDNLPLVDDLYGSQYLLVPVEYNTALAGKGLKTKDSGGESYYILTEGTYENVVVGEDYDGNRLNAATITVQKTNGTETSGLGTSYAGLHTQIKWYFSHLDGGKYRKTIRYLALVDMDINGLTYSLGNEVWMNDRKNARIYASVFGSGTTFGFDKSIVDTAGDSPAGDVLNEEDYSQIGEGESVTYRLTVSNDPNTSKGGTLSGTNLIDMLPETSEAFSWEKGVNVELRYVLAGDATATGLENWSIVDAGETSIGLLGTRKCIVWPGETSVTLTGNSKLYIYITLTFPSDTDGGAQTWSEYLKNNNGAKLENTMYLFRESDSVTHDLKQSGKAFVQKGVVAQQYETTGPHISGSDRRHYANTGYNGIRNHSVLYYACVYNGGYTRLYLNDLQDSLPTGFRFTNLHYDTFALTDTAWRVGQSCVTKGGTSCQYVDAADLGGGQVTFRSAKITASASSDKKSVTFKVSAGSGSYAVKYDADAGKYYLEHGEALVFAYYVDQGTYKETEDTAVNAICMPYTDYLSTGVSIVDKEKVEVNGTSALRYPDTNDGERRLLGSDAVSSEFGFSSDGGETQWLVSTVTMERGDIVPGITKTVKSYTAQNGTTSTEYKSSVGPFDTVNWSVRVQNSGTTAMLDYTVTDTLPSPYVFTGSVTYALYDDSGKSLGSGTLATFTEKRDGTETAVKMKIGNDTYTLPVDGTHVAASLTHDGSGNEVLSFHLKEPAAQTYSIPEGGYIEFTFSAYNPTTQYVNTVYLNQASVQPNLQTFEKAAQGSLVRDEDGKPSLVTSSAPVTVSFGFATSSEKRVTEVSNEENTVVSTDVTNNTITLSAEDSVFRYTLTVKNGTDEAMSRLVFIDSLPQVGDHSPFSTTAARGSEYQVNFASNPDVKVVVSTTDADGNTTDTELDKQYYTVEYSKDTDFGKPQGPDWKGETSGTTASWGAFSTDARSIRIVITDEGKTQIPKDATVSASFSAVAADGAEPGKTAWNSFGYHYKLDTEELEAMPMSVGVKTPAVPTITKELCTDTGKAVKADTDTTFRFLIYEGEAVEYTSEEALKAALDDAGTKYTEASVTVKAGESKGTVKVLSDNIVWKDGTKYTAVELTQESAKYKFLEYAGGGSAKGYTFTYDIDGENAITCRNRVVSWNITLTKVDSRDSSIKLKDAVFALYSPDKNDQIEVPTEYASLAGATLNAEDTDWYLCAVGVTDDNGQIVWSNVYQKQYYLLEIRAPEAYIKSETGQILSESGVINGNYPVTVVNTTSYELPETGGTGTLPFLLGGIALLSGGALLAFGAKRRRERRARS